MAVVFDRKCLFLLCVLTSISRCQTQSCSSNLTNTVVYEGSSASFNRVNNGQSVQWAVVSSSDFYNSQKNITNYDDVVVSQFNTNYAVTASGLMIFSSTITPQGSSPISTAGLYIIKYQNSNCTYGANLIVIRSGPECSYNVSDPNNVNLLCSVDFAESSVQPNNPVFTWKNSTTVVMQIQPIPSQISSYLKRSTSQLSIYRSDVTRYECQLTFGQPPNSPMNYVTRTAPDYSSSCRLWRDFIMGPTSGPAAGGTFVTIEAKWMALENVSISAVYIGENLKADIDRTSTEIVIATTPAIENELQINQQLTVILEISPISTNITAGKYFTYKPNPRIDDANPKRLHISGGVRLNISGANLDSATQPFVLAEVVIRRGNVITYNNQSISSCFQPTENGTQMICLSPPIYIRDDFLQQLFGETYPYNNNRRKRENILNYGWKREDRTVPRDTAHLSIRSKRSTPISTNQTYYSRDGEDEMEIYVGIVFDGFERYLYNILADSGRSFSLCNPTFKCDSDIEFDGNTITIQGRNLTQCYGPSDYTVRIGNGNCTVKTLTDNELKCNPPENKPQQTKNDTKYNCGKDFVVIVELGGFKVYRCSCLKYPNDDRTKRIIIAATVVPFVVVLIIITVIVVLVSRSKKAKQAPHRESRDTQLIENSYTMSDHWLRNDIRSIQGYDNSLSYRRPIDTIYVDSTESGEYYTKELPGSFSESADQMPGGPDDYLSSVEDNYKNAVEAGCYETTID